jgi:protein-tyrosine phosphatase
VAEPDPPVGILVVCTGNLHRSPMIETVLRTELANHGRRFDVTSAGTAARRWQRWPEQTVETLASAGYPVQRSRGRRLTSAQIRGARLVLTATRAHRIDVLALDGGAELRCFTLLEAARYLASPGSGNSGVIDDLHAALRDDRGDHHDDLADPIGGTDMEFSMCLRSVQSAVAVIAPRLNTL